MKKIILSAFFAFSAVAFLPSSSKAQTAPKVQSTSTGQTTTNRAMTALEPTNALQAWSEAYQYAMSHNFGLSDSLWYANARMKVWIYYHGG
jgi:hypothetical protein